MAASGWILLAGLVLGPLVALWLVSVLRYRRQRARDAAKWRRLWEPLAEARGLRLDPVYARDLNGGPGFHQTWYVLRGVVESVPYRIGLGIITYGYDGLLMVEAAIPVEASGTLVVAARGARSPLDGLTESELPDEGLTLFCDAEESARKIASAAVRDSIMALYDTGPDERKSFFTSSCGALLVLRGSHAQVVLPVRPVDLDLALLDAAVEVIASLARAVDHGVTS